MKLTKRRIESLKFDPEGPAQQIEWDDRMQNFGVRLYKSGTKSFVIRYRNERGKRRYMTIGKFGVLTLRQARTLARQELAAAAIGEDPAEQRKRARDAETVADLVDTFIRTYSKPRKKTWKSDESRLECVKKAWGDKPPADVTHSDVDALHRAMSDTPYRANRTLENIKTMFNFAVDRGLVPRDHRNPATNVKKYHEKSRDRWVHEDEMPALLQSIEDESDPYMRAVFWTLILTGARRSEVLGAQWKHIDLERRTFYIPETKNGEDHTVPMCAPLIRILDGLERLEGNPFVFCGHVEGQALVNIDKAWYRIRERADLDNVRIHDLRRTCAAWLATAGRSELVIKRLLNHSVQGVTAIYARVGPKAVRKAVDEYGRQIMGAWHEVNAAAPWEKANDGADNVIDLATARGKA